MYLDIEYHKTAEANQDIDERFAVQTIIQSLVEFVQIYFDVEAERSDFLILDSSSEKKFSRHVIMAGDNKLIFEDNATLKAFVLKYLEFCASRSGNDVTTRIIDKRVYGENQHFRLLFSWKAKEDEKPRVFRVADDNEFEPPMETSDMTEDGAFFLSSLVLNVDSGDFSKRIGFDDLPFATLKKHPRARSKDHSGNKRDTGV